MNSTYKRLCTKTTRTSSTCTVVGSVLIENGTFSTWLMIGVGIWRSLSTVSEWSQSNKGSKLRQFSQGANSDVMTNYWDGGEMITDPKYKVQDLRGRSELTDALVTTLIAPFHFSAWLTCFGHWILRPHHKPKAFPRSCVLVHSLRSDFPMHYILINC